MIFIEASITFFRCELTVIADLTYQPYIIPIDKYFLNRSCLDEALWADSGMLWDYLGFIILKDRLR